MIRFNCCKCGQKMSAEDYALGRTIKCPNCNNPQEVPAPEADVPQAQEFFSEFSLLDAQSLEAAEGGDDSEPAKGLLKFLSPSVRRTVILLSVMLGVLAIVGIILHYALRDPWEEQDGPRIVMLEEEARKAMHHCDYSSAVEKYEEILRLAAGRSAKNEELAAALLRANAQITEARIGHVQRVSSEFWRSNEAYIRQAMTQADEHARNRRDEQALELINQVLALYSQCPSPIGKAGEVYQELLASRTVLSERIGRSHTSAERLGALGSEIRMLETQDFELLSFLNRANGAVVDSLTMLPDPTREPGDDWREWYEKKVQEHANSQRLNPPGNNPSAIRLTEMLGEIMQYHQEALARWKEGLQAAPEYRVQYFNHRDAKWRRVGQMNEDFRIAWREVNLDHFASSMDIFDKKLQMLAIQIECRDSQTLGGSINDLQSDLQKISATLKASGSPPATPQQALDMAIQAVSSLSAAISNGKRTEALSTISSFNSYWANNKGKR
jgi:hypothetical protein